MFYRRSCLLVFSTMLLGLLLGVPFLGIPEVQAKPREGSIFVFENKRTIIEQDLAGNKRATLLREVPMSTNGDWLYYNKNGCQEGLQFGLKKDKEKIDELLRSGYEETAARSKHQDLLPPNNMGDFDSVYFDVALYGIGQEAGGAGCSSDKIAWSMISIQNTDLRNITFEWGENDHILKRVDGGRTYIRSSSHPEYNKHPNRFYYTQEKFNDCQDYIEVDSTQSSGYNEELDEDSGDEGKSKAYPGCNIVEKRTVRIGNLTGAPGAGVSPEDKDNPLGTLSESDQCESSGVLSWILCPVVTTLRDGFETLANDYAVPLLKVRPLDNSSSLFEVWKNFRIIANIFFVIVFFIIIFSTAINNRE